MRGELRRVRTTGIRELSRWIARLALATAGADLAIMAYTGWWGAFGTVALLVALAATMTALARATTPRRLAAIERAMIGLLLAGITAVVALSRHPVALGHFVPYALFVAFVEREARWRAYFLAAGATAFAYALAHYGTVPRDALPAAALLAVQSLHLAVSVGLSLVGLRHFLKLAGVLRRGAREGRAARQAAVAESRANAALLGERLRELDGLRARRRASVRAERAARATVRARREAVEQFAYAASHDLKEPVRTIRSFTQVARKRLPPALADDPALGEYFTHVTESAGAMHAVLESLLEYSRATRAERAPRAIDAEAVARARLAEAGLAPAQPPAGAAAAFADPAALALILGALVDNVVKFAAPRSGADVDLAVAAVGDALEVRLADRGPGVAPEYRERVFGLFQRLHARGEYPGSGIGLALARRVARQCGGDLRLDGNPAGGATAVLTLPLAPATQQPPAAGALA